MRPAYPDTKARQEYYKERTHRLRCVMNTDANIFNKTAAVQIQQHIKSIIYCDQVVFTPEMLEQLPLASQSMYTTLDKNYTIITIDAEKASNKIQHPFIIKKSKLFIYWKNVPQHSKNHMTSLQLTQWWEAKSFPVRSGISKDACSHHFYSTRYWKP